MISDNEINKFLEPSLYDIMGVGKNANRQQIKARFIELSKMEHPDVSRRPKEQAHETFIRIRLAYEVLMDVNGRQRYDNMLLNYEQKKREAKQKASQKKNDEKERDLSEIMINILLESLRGNKSDTSKTHSFNKNDLPKDPYERFFFVLGVSVTKELLNFLKR